MANPLRALVAPAAVAAALLAGVATAPATPAATGCAPSFDPGFLLPTPATDIDPRFRLALTPAWHDAGFPRAGGTPCPPAAPAPPATPGSAPARPLLAGRPR